MNKQAIIFLIAGLLIGGGIVYAFLNAGAVSVDNSSNTSTSTSMNKTKTGESVKQATTSSNTGVKVKTKEEILNQPFYLHE